MTCPACTESRLNRWCGHYRADCLECSARMLSHSPEHFEAKTAGKLTPDYLKALQSVFGEDWKAWHERVKAWAERRQG